MEAKFISEEVKGLSEPLVAEKIAAVAAKYGLDATIVSPVFGEEAPWCALYPWFANGMVRIKVWFGTRDLHAQEFFASPTNDVDKRMRRYVAEQVSPVVE